MKQIKLRYIGFSGAKWEDTLVINILRKRYEVVVTQDADYAIVGPFDEGMEALNFPGVRIFWTMENVSPDFSLYDYGIGFDDLSFGDRYIRYPLSYSRDSINEKMLRKAEGMSPKAVAEKELFCLFMYSHEGTPVRKELFDKLSAYKKVTSIGDYLRNTDVHLPYEGQDRKQQIEWEGKAKFVIAAENSSFPGYVTEKLSCALAAKSIPIYYGDPTVGKEMNLKAFINCRDYPSIDAVVQRVIELDQNDELYLQMINEPVFDSPTFLAERQKSLEDFLYHIFDQEYSEAFRRPMDSDFLLKNDQCMKRADYARYYSKTLQGKISKKLRTTVLFNNYLSLKRKKGESFAHGWLKKEAFHTAGKILRRKLGKK